MIRFILRQSKILLLMVPALLLWGLAQPGLAGTPLDDYVAVPDASYGWSHYTSVPGAGYTAHVLDLTSQTWRDLSEVNRTEWHHWLTMIVPDTVDYDQAMLLIGGGSNGGPPDLSDDLLIFASAIATATNSVTAYLETVPNQPLSFTGDYLANREEDQIIAYTWAKFMDSYRAGTPDLTWPAQLPMTNSAVRAMDAMQEFLATPEGGSLTINEFMVGGGSKRGWTTWLTAAVDDRVAAIAPMVIDVLNVEQSLQHHYEVYGFWAPAVHDYVEAGVLDVNLQGAPELKALMDIVDPYSYLDRLDMPKFIINSTGDQFFLPDSSQFYYSDLPGVKYLRYMPNTDHSLEQNALSLVNSLALFYQAQLAGTALPEFSWTMNEDGSISVDVVDEPIEVKLWQATNPAGRDFRYEIIDPAWSSSTLHQQPDGSYQAQLPLPEEGWTAFLVELYYDSGLGTPHIFTTEVMVIPEPATLGLVLLGGLLVGRRQKRAK